MSISGGSCEFWCTRSSLSDGSISSKKIDKKSQTFMCDVEFTKHGQTLIAYIGGEPDRELGTAADSFSR
jgi:hypothetical protein